MYNNNRFLAFFKSPIAAVCMLAAVGVVIWTACGQIRKFKQKKAG